MAHSKLFFPLIIWFFSENSWRIEMWTWWWWTNCICPLQVVPRTGGGGGMLTFLRLRFSCAMKHARHRSSEKSLSMPRSSPWTILTDQSNCLVSSIASVISPLKDLVVGGVRSCHPMPSFAERTAPSAAHASGVQPRSPLRITVSKHRCFCRPGS